MPAAPVLSRTGSSVPPVEGGIDVPSRSDGFVRTVSRRLGGPIGRYAAIGTSWWNPARVVLLSATVCYLVAVLWRLPCRVSAPGQTPDTFKLMCYSDISLLYQARGLMAGNVPYLQSGGYDVLEYPPLTGWFLDLERRISALLGAQQGLDLSDRAQVHSTLVFVDVNIVLLGALFLLTVWAQLRTVPGRPWDAMMLAVSPCVAAAALINWDLLAVALTALACLLWSRRRPGWAGLLFGLGMAAKLYPALLLAPLLLLCLRSRRVRAYAVLLGAALVSWAVVNLPVIIWAPDAWLYFWRFNAQRGPDLGSIWYIASLAGYQISDLNLVSTIALGIACAGLAGLILLAPRRPRFGQVAFLVVLAFAMTNKVYSPQYVLWLVPLFVLARPRWRDWWVFSVGELIYFGAIWWHLGGELAPGGGSEDRLYWLAVLIRLGTEACVAALVVRDVLHPDADPVRRNGADDPGGGVLDGAPDARWVRGTVPVDGD
jgi:uncharacterized membrane protein